MEIRTTRRARGHRGAFAAREAAARAGAMAALAATPVLAWALAVATWDSGSAIAAGLSRAPSMALAPLTLGEGVAVVAGAGGAAVAAHLSVMSLVLVVAPRHSRVRRAALRLTPGAWRRVVSIAATGALSAGLALPAGATPGDSDAGWIPEPIAPRSSLVEPPVSHPVLPPPVGREGQPAAAPESGGSETPTTAAPADRSRDRLHVVAPGDSLWSITADAIDGGLHDGSISRDAGAIAAAWPQLYEANRETVGTDPSLIHPGQELTIPPGWER
ncbi:LysM peptidoglycan-binding domain-containing protein [Demequina aestuarii]|uniref:LysM peptidoglycan-binding domain-containing protein n=1 Tax=Demequina aestuarii TaxID=327095 RepID=UPI0009FFA570|nr:LysM peptidoglycan-binding domain-containing protein [Demequina aestuarii]